MKKIFKFTMTALVLTLGALLIGCPTSIENITTGDTGTPFSMQGKFIPNDEIEAINFNLAGTGDSSFKAVNYSYKITGTMQKGNSTPLVFTGLYDPTYNNFAVSARSGNSIYALTGIIDPTKSGNKLGTTSGFTITGSGTGANAYTAKGGKAELDTLSISGMPDQSSGDKIPADFQGNWEADMGSETIFKLFVADNIAMNFQDQDFENGKRVMAAGNNFILQVSQDDETSCEFIVYALMYKDEDNKATEDVRDAFEADFINSYLGSNTDTITLAADEAAFESAGGPAAWLKGGNLIVYKGFDDTQRQQLRDYSWSNRFNAYLKKQSNDTKFFSPAPYSKYRVELNGGKLILKIWESSSTNSQAFNIAD